MHVIVDSDAYPCDREAVQRLAPQPCTIRETGLTDSFLGELVCKHLFAGHVAAGGTPGADRRGT